MVSWLAFEPVPGFRLHLASSERGLSRLGMALREDEFLADLCTTFGTCVRNEREPFLRAARAQLVEYFAGRRQEFDVPLDLQGTAFQRRVWAALATIPYGETRSYIEVARQIGQPTAPRAVGTANGANPIGIIVPCHRVIAADGTLCGFGGGLARKRMLLELEAAHRDSSVKVRRAAAGPARNAAR